jgi:hypothetical protein
MNNYDFDGESQRRFDIRYRINFRNARQVTVMRLASDSNSEKNCKMFLDDRTPTTSRPGLIIKRKLKFGGKNIQPRTLFSSLDPEFRIREDAKSPGSNKSSLRPIEDQADFK